MTRVSYIGNLGPDSAPHSTENHVARAFEANGVQVDRIHEQRFDWDHTRVGDVDFVAWTHTHGFAPQRTHPRQSRFLEALERRGIPTVGLHLDRWWDLQREHQIFEEPFFRQTLVCTADGGSDERWAAAGVNHHWFPPGVSAPECAPGTYRPEFASEIAFVGSWFGGYHPESNHRRQLIDWLKSVYGVRCRFWPAPGEHAVRGEALRDLYASVKVLVGDSCLIGTGKNHSYISDRVPETVGRGGLLVHPHVGGATDGTLYTAGEHLLTWPAWDWDAAANTIDSALADPDLRRQISTAGRAHVLSEHSYERRCEQILETLTERGLIKQEAAA